MKIAETFDNEGIHLCQFKINVEKFVNKILLCLLLWLSQRIFLSRCYFTSIEYVLHTSLNIRNNRFDQNLLIKIWKHRRNSFQQHPQYGPQIPPRSLHIRPNLPAHSTSLGKHVWLESAPPPCTNFEGQSLNEQWILKTAFSKKIRMWNIMPVY